MYSMKEACQQVGMTYEALKFYCNEGLVPNVKREELLRRIEELNACVDYIDWKQGFYDDVLSGKTKYSSNLIRVEEKE